VNYEKDRYKMYKQALYAATHDSDFMSKHPDFALSHARAFYDDLKHEGYRWYADSGVWSKTVPKKEQPRKQSKSPTEGIPTSELFKVRIIAPADKIAMLAQSTRTLYEMADCVVLRQSPPRSGRWTEKHKIVYFDFRLPG
jgi:hypothetical protein